MDTDSGRTRTVAVCQDPRAGSDFRRSRGDDLPRRVGAWRGLKSKPETPHVVSYGIGVTGKEGRKREHRTVTRTPPVHLRTPPYTSVHQKAPGIEIFGSCELPPWRGVKHRTPHPACGHVDSLAPARSARCGLSAPPNSFRRFPTTQVFPADAEKGRTAQRDRPYHPKTLSLRTVTMDW
jgi:hypothetical protein